MDEAVDILTRKINSILDEMAPIKTFQTKSKYCPWLTEETKELIKQRNNAQKVLSENKIDENLEHYKNLRNRVTKNVRNDKIKWRKNKLE